MEVPEVIGRQSEIYSLLPDVRHILVVTDGSVVRATNECEQMN
jgi:hypothetical protein